jgi:aminoglycoside phosphotransferase (APT) family kinase protein
MSSSAEIVVDGDVVTKLHRAGTDPRALAVRLRTAATLDSFLSPLSVEIESVGTRWRTRWPRLEPVPPDPVEVPWAEAARLLARLHNDPSRIDVPHGGPDMLRRRLAALPEGQRATTLRRAAERLPDDLWAAGPSTLVHGDWHLGQIGRQHGQWLLIDIDDLGVGNPAWDLARPAGFWAAGLIPDADWAVFLDAYRDAAGPALPRPPADPWPALDGFARAAVIQAAALGYDDEAAALLLEACGRM